MTSVQQHKFFCVFNPLVACPSLVMINLVNEITVMLRFFGVLHQVRVALASHYIILFTLKYIYNNKSNSFSESPYCQVFQPWYY